MGLPDWFRPPRSLLVLFLGTTFVLLTGLGWLGLRVLDQERAIEVQRVRDQIEGSADLIAAEIRQNLADIEEQLIRLSVLPAGNLERAATSWANTLGPNAVVVIFGPETVEAYPDGRLIYYPIVPEADSPPAQTFATGDTYEFRSSDFDRAIAYYEQVAQSDDPSTRAEALLRLARNERKAGKLEAALDTYRELAEMGTVGVAGQPAELRALHARCGLLERLGRHEELKDGARALAHGLETGRWVLTAPAFANYMSDVEAWLGRDRESGQDTFGLSLAEGVAGLWERWRLDPEAQEWLEGSDSVVRSGQLTFLLWSGTGGRLAALLAVGDFLSSHVIGPSEGVLERQGVGIELSDSQGRIIAASSNAGSEGTSTEGSVLRTRADTRLPWTLRLINTDPEARPDRIGMPRTLLFAALGFVGLLVVAGSYFSARAITRESEAARLQSDFVAAVSHEFRTPLTSMRQFTDLLADGRVRSETERIQYYDALSRGTQRLTRLVEGLLDFGRMEAGSHGFRMELVDARRWLEGVTTEFQEEVSRRGFEIEVAWHAKDDAVVMADGAALGRALWNLLDNAVKYSSHSKTVRVDARSEHSMLKIRVRDAGIGIPAAEQRGIFRKFVRGSHPAGHTVKGTGLGLALVDQIVRAHGGTVEVESKVGEGSTFSISLPEQV